VLVTLGAAGAVAIVDGALLHAAAHPVIPEQVPNPGEIVFAANRYYARPAARSVPVLQLSYDDMVGRFPWEAGYAASEMQPRPGTFRA
jgi:hypothetical protein